MSVSRRSFLSALGAFTATAGGFERAYARAIQTPALWSSPRDTLWLTRAQTGEHVVGRLRVDGEYNWSDHLLLSWLMRDVASGNRAVWIEPKLFDLLAAVQGAMSDVAGHALPLVVSSGYRTPQHNAAIEGAARNSLHKFGYASDLSVHGYPSSAIALAGAMLAQGGIGVYSTFCHLDVGALRLWTERRRHPKTPKPGTPIAQPSAQQAANPPPAPSEGTP